jgi:hypothetical protein
MEIDPTLIRQIRLRWKHHRHGFNEREKRLFCATEVAALGRGGLKAVAEITGVARSTILRGLKDLADGVANIPGKVRRPGGGRKRSPGRTRKISQ